MAILINQVPIKYGAMLWLSLSTNDRVEFSNGETYTATAEKERVENFSINGDLVHIKTLTGDTLTSESGAITGTILSGHSDLDKYIDDEVIRYTELRPDDGTRLHLQQGTNSTTAVMIMEDGTKYFGEQILTQLGKFPLIENEGDIVFSKTGERGVITAGKGSWLSAGERVKGMRFEADDFDGLYFNPVKVQAADIYYSRFTFKNNSNADDVTMCLLSDINKNMLVGFWRSYSRLIIMAESDKGTYHSFNVPGNFNEDGKVSVRLSGAVLTTYFNDALVDTCTLDTPSEFRTTFNYCRTAIHYMANGIFTKYVINNETFDLTKPTSRGGHLQVIGSNGTIGDVITENKNAVKYVQQYMRGMPGVEGAITGTKGNSDYARTANITNSSTNKHFPFKYGFVDAYFTQDGAVNKSILSHNIRGVVINTTAVTAFFYSESEDPSASESTRDIQDVSLTHLKGRHKVEYSVSTDNTSVTVSVDGTVLTTLKAADTSKVVKWRESVLRYKASTGYNYSDTNSTDKLYYPVFSVGVDSEVWDFNKITGNQVVGSEGTPLTISTSHSDADKYIANEMHRALPCKS